MHHGKKSCRDLNFIVPVAILTSTLYQVQQCSKPAVAFSSVPTIACSNFCTMSMQTCLKCPCFYFRSMLWKQFIWQKWHTRDQFKTNLHLNCCICFIVPAVPFTLQADLCREASLFIVSTKVLSRHCSRWHHRIQPQVSTDLSGTGFTVPCSFLCPKPVPGYASSLCFFFYSPVSPGEKD